MVYSLHPCICQRPHFGVRKLFAYTQDRYLYSSLCDMFKWCKTLCDMFKWCKKKCFAKREKKRMKSPHYRFMELGGRCSGSGMFWWFVLFGTAINTPHRFITVSVVIHLIVSYLSTWGSLESVLTRCVELFRFPPSAWILLPSLAWTSADFFLPSFLPLSKTRAKTPPTWPLVWSFVILWWKSSRKWMLTRQQLRMM